MIGAWLLAVAWRVAVDFSNMHCVNESDPSNWQTNELLQLAMRQATAALVRVHLRAFKEQMPAAL
jgi:hypothetical protein